MHGLVFDDIGSMVWKEVAAPGLDEFHNILVKISAVGICGSDIHGYLGLTGRRIPPMIMGHEMAGIVEAAGPGTSLKKGQPVVILPFVNCGKCEFCKKGKTNFCTDPVEYYGILKDNGGMAEYLAVPEHQLVPIPDTTNLVHASLAEPLAVAYGGARKITDPEDSPLLLFGAGAIGLLSLQVLRALGNRSVYVCDANERRLEKAKTLGAKECFVPGNALPETVRDIIENGGFPRVLDAVGVPATYENGVQWAAIGAKIVWVGNACKTVTLEIPDIVMKELTIAGSFIYTRQEIADAIALINSGSIDCGILVELTEKMENGPEVFRRLAIEKEDRIKAVLVNG
ncbi:zinc-dependent alcohol dehydrogenase [Breznakiella homolactica]|uniref:Alcohol dehydrogenase catalytic domain-containing protein n=1 Tax=Breznakiella homolactica TaxID=2798577 RepID=A0A7T7XNM4_9SPIR|nr:alcohol dehydrogenase catalytic domain-containing protein [Breznakiella homolactica]QQO09646.1 alcohol dehydrogenase catalytic domain-containing protein [Breznakiella homolactica]